MRRWLPGMLGCMLIVVAPVGAQGPVGEWRVADGRADIRIVDCEGVLWGVVSWEKTPGRDTKNPDPALRNRSTLGMPVLLHMKPSRQRPRWDGKVYNADNGKTYSASIQLRGPDTLHVRGCTLRILCGGEDWTRVTKTADTTRVDAPASPATVAAASICAGVGAASEGTSDRELSHGQLGSAGF